MSAWCGLYKDFQKLHDLGPYQSYRYDSYGMILATYILIPNYGDQCDVFVQQIVDIQLSSLQK